MKRINSSYFLELGGYLNQLKTLTTQARWVDAFVPLAMTEVRLRELVEKKEPIELTFCLNDATQLQKVLHRVMGNRAKGPQNQEEKIDVGGAVEVQYLAEAFEKSLITELRETNTYFVSSVGIFSTSALLTKAEEMFGEHRNLMPEMTVALIQEAGKCLAFSLGSAAAFHLFGALESVLKEYYDTLSSGKAPPKNPGMGAYINELAAMTGADQKLIAALRQVKDLHRNPAVHFDTILTMGQALTLVGMIHSAISTTLDVVSKLPSAKPDGSKTRPPGNGLSGLRNQDRKPARV